MQPIVCLENVETAAKKAQKEGFMLFMWLDNIRINTELTIHIETNYFLVPY